MATISELVDSRELTTGQNPSEVRHYLVEDTSDREVAMDTLSDTAPEWAGDLKRSDLTVEPTWVDTISDTGHWDCLVRYNDPESSTPESGESTFNFDTGGGSQHITQSLSTISKQGLGGSQPDFKGAIGVTDTSVDGADIVVPIYRFSETHYLSDSTVTQAYRNTLFDLTGTMNNATFKGLFSGECRFDGASGSKRTGELWQLTYNFASSPNKTNITVGAFTVAAKLGWDYLWVRYGDIEDTAAKAIVKQPISVNVERVYEFRNFAALGLGT